MRALSLNNVVKRYGRQRALDGASLEVPAGSVFGLIGPNGAGKTTTFGVICGWTRHDAGEVNVLGVPPTALHSIGARVGSVPQDAQLPRALSARDVLFHLARLVGLDAAHARHEVTRVIDLVGLGEHAHKRAAQLSHGMRRRLAIAQALLGSPDLVLFDEPTSGLDPMHARAVKDLMASLALRATVVVSSHNLTELQELCTHAAILDHGKVVRSGTMAELTGQGHDVVVRLHQPTAELGAYVATLSLSVPHTHVAWVDGHAHLQVQEDVAVPHALTELLQRLIERGGVVDAVVRGTSLEKTFLSTVRGGTK